jgi:hypothetical protein
LLGWKVEELRAVWSERSVEAAEAEEAEAEEAEAEEEAVVGA